MSNPITPPAATLSNIARLASLAASVANREAAARAEHQRRHEQARIRAASVRSSLQARDAATRDAARTGLESDLQSLDAHAHRRIERLRLAQRQARRSASERIDAEEGRRKFELQREMLRATRERDAGLDTANATHAAFLARLEASRADLAGLETEARDLLGVFGRPTLLALANAHASARADLTRQEDSLAAELTDTLAATRAELASFRRRFLPRLSRSWPITLIVVLSPAILIPILDSLRITEPSHSTLVTAALALALAAVALHFLGRRLARPAVARIIDALGQCRLLAQAAGDKAAESHRAERARLEALHDGISRSSDAAWHEVIHWLEENRTSVPARVDARAARALLRLQERQRAARTRREDTHAARLRELDAETKVRMDEVDAEAVRIAAALDAERAATRQALAAEWAAEAGPILASLEAFETLAAGPAFAVDPLPGPDWLPPEQPAPHLRFGRLEVDLAAILRPLTADVGLGSIPSGRLSLPLVLEPPAHGSLLLETAPAARATALGTLNQLLTRTLATSPAGRVSFTLFDPVGLGQTFASFTHLADEAEHVINGRIWTQTAQLEERLAELNEHLEKVIQMYLRNDYPTIAEYNEQAGNIAEKYRFLVLADFPAGFTDTALRRLLALATSGARCGVFLLIHWDPRHPLPSDFPVATLRQSALTLTLPAPPQPILVQGHATPGTVLHLDPPPDPNALAAFIQRVAHANRDSYRVEVPFDQIAPPARDIWSLTTAAEIRVPIGRTGATKLQHLALGKATRQHALIAGKTGSGKSTLFHVLITNLALWCPPDEVEFYLVDFKKGVEFKCYATHRLPHARVVAIESDREFGLSVLQRLDEELRRRGELFRAAGVQDLAAYRRSPGAPPLPRTLLLVDEFQEFFVEEDRIAQNASVLLDRIVRQGRAFGIHVILGSQTLGGAYTVARSTLGQMVVRIALQCNEADALLIMDEDNPAPRLLSRPGEALYNDAAGARTGNSPFQVVWLPDHVRDSHLRGIRDRADALPIPAPAPLVFEGDAPAGVRDNPALGLLLAAPSAPAPAPSPIPIRPRIWLGAPNSIKGPTEVTFSRRAADNLLVVGQRDDALTTLLSLALVALAAEHPRGSARFILLDGSPPESGDRATLEHVARSIPHDITLVRPGDIGPVISDLAAELHARTGEAPRPDAPARYILVHGIQHFRLLRPEDEFAYSSAESAPPPATLFRELLTEGPVHGFHSLVTGDTWNTVTRFLGRKLFAEFGVRVLFQMSANDSASLIDNPAASRLGLHRALLHLDREGSLEIFRPYAPPDPAWIADATRQLSRLLA